MVSPARFAGQSTSLSDLSLIRVRPALQCQTNLGIDDTFVTEIYFFKNEIFLSKKAFFASLLCQYALHTVNKSSYSILGWEII